MTTEVPTSKPAIAALILGILSFLGGILFTGIPALFLGYKGRTEIRRANGQLKGRGMAEAGILMGWTIIALSLLATVFFIYHLLIHPIKSHALVTSSQITSAALENANLAFFAEYGAYPHRATTSSASTDLRTQSDGSVMNALLGSGPGSTTLNPTGIKFLSASSRSIITDPAGNQSLVDSYGNLFQIIFDTNGDGTIADPFTGLPVSKTVLIWSNGSDGISGTIDDIKNWP